MADIITFTGDEIQALRHAAPEGMVLIPPGEFIMGDGFRESLHKVYLDPFYMDIYQVTSEQFKKFLKETGYCSEGTIKRVRSMRKGSERNPVIRVTWDDAVAFAGWAGKRLPTEAEWEKAARGGLQGAYYAWGNDPPDDSKANYARLVGHPTDVGSYPQNGYGLYDMCGNVWEWCADWFDINFYNKSSHYNPRGPEKGKERVLRGGSWFMTPNNMKCSYRSSHYPDYKDGTIGFRCVKSIDINPSKKR